MTDLFRVAVLAGGLSLERDVSLRSGSQIRDALSDAGHDARLIDVDANLSETVAEGAFDVAFVAVHGAGGDDGAVQSVLELAGVPFVGSPSDACRRAWNKSVAHDLFVAHEIPVPKTLTVPRGVLRELGAEKLFSRVHDMFGDSVIVKPATSGSSLGVARVQRDQDLPSALRAAFGFSDTVLVQELIHGVEVAAPFVAGEALELVELVPQGAAYDFAARYSAGGAKFFCPARLDAAAAVAVKEAAARASSAVGARDLWRVDLIVDEAGHPHVLEVATTPGMTDTSLVPAALQASGLDPAKILSDLVSGAVSRG